ncbi:MAG: hypothetical protein WC821_04445 [archaeon]|jgi:hypothetical protein
MKEYSGPIFFIVHGPYRNSIADPKNNILSVKNRKRIIEMLNKAGQRRIPVLYSPEITTAAAMKQDIEGTVENILKFVKYKPRVIELTTFGFSSEEVSRVLKKQKIMPTQITCAGYLRDHCVLQWAKAAREAFPKAKINILAGASSVLMRQESSIPFEREKFAEKMRKASIKQVRKLTPRHFV